MSGLTKHTKAVNIRFPHALLEELDIKKDSYENRYTGQPYSRTEFIVEACKEKLLRDTKQT